MQKNLLLLALLVFCINVNGAPKEKGLFNSYQITELLAPDSANFKTLISNIYPNTTAAVVFVKKRSIQKKLPAFWDAAAVKELLSLVLKNPLIFLVGISLLFTSKLIRFSKNYYLNLSSRKMILKKGQR